jgi:succinylarginine dihydrolase
MADATKLDTIAEVVAAHWPETIAPDQLGNPDLLDKVRLARLALLEATDLLALA